MNNRGYFITGTDTGVGKTHIACALLKKLGDKGYRTLGLKPVSSGGIQTSLGLRNRDALLLQESANIKLPYEAINPFCFLPPIAPHIAAEQSGVSLNVNSIMKTYSDVQKKNIDKVLVEGAGGWKVPLNRDETMADLANAFGFPVIMVVAIRLGCINHAILTYESIKQSKIKAMAWVANICDVNLSNIEENIMTIKQKIDIPLLWVNRFNMEYHYVNANYFS